MQVPQNTDGNEHTGLALLCRGDLSLCNMCSTSKYAQCEHQKLCAHVLRITFLLKINMKF